MSNSYSAVADYGEYREFCDRVNEVFDISSRLPRQVFRRIRTESLFGPYDDVIDPEFWPVIANLAKLHGDDKVFLLVVDPDPREYYLRETGLYPAVSFSLTASEEDYWEAVGFDSVGDVKPSIALSSEVIALTGESGRWGCWAERSPEVAVYRGDLSGIKGNDELAKRFGPFRSVVDSLSIDISRSFRSDSAPGWYSEELTANYDDKNL
ncbi:hypothetical protein VSH64_09485 [Amycolatopsis rhabdoformis]|uniref:Uncharacterized protein n=1 Tax=Amycolatopsis rhabdoformis TaxID=1448059 RepID=A0ABZ1IE21_9PSEU|nr:hypothetical protein [Amycolatopsis rhabdoformis]WSE32334.1 hypothetical protein VSH64_09485 [Amycolatopsis rhabdoformis]